MTYTQRRVFIASYLLTVLLGFILGLISGQGRFVVLMLVIITSLPPFVTYWCTPDGDTLDTAELDEYFTEVLAVLRVAYGDTLTPTQNIEAIGRVLLEYDFGLYLESEALESTHAIESEEELDANLPQWLELGYEDDSIVAHKWIGRYLLVTFIVATVEDGKWVIDDRLVKGSSAIQTWGIPS